MAFQGIRCKIGDGRKALFWHDTWVGDRPLKMVFPRLFSIASIKDAPIESMGSWDGWSWSWNLSWTRSLRTRDALERDSLQALLEEVCLSFESSDEFIWAFCKSGSFSVKSFSHEMAKHDAINSQNIRINIWRGLVPPRIEIFAWLACLGKLNTRAKLAKLNIIDPNQVLCPLCNKSAETVDHLLIHYDFSWRIWGWWMNIWDFKWAIPSSLKEIFNSWHPPSSQPLFKKIWWAIFYIIIWSIWKVRNERIFSDS